MKLKGTVDLPDKQLKLETPIMHTCLTPIMHTCLE